jgi:transposase
MKTFRPYEPDQMLLLPPSLSDWVPEDHLARFVSDLVDTLDLSAIEDTYTEERGFPPYHPCMMVKVLLYAYCTGTYASRRIARQLQDSVALRYLAAGNQPDFRTISDFRKHHLPALAGLFEQVLTICREAGMVKLGRVAVDGTKMKANASKHKAMSYGRMREKDKALKREIRELLDRAEAADRDDDRRYGSGGGGEDLPAELARRDSRLKKIREARATLEARVRERAEAEGKNPKHAKPKPKDQHNFTDPESRIQKTSSGYIQGYNAQLSADAEWQVVVAQHVTSNASDARELQPAVDAIKKTLRAKPKAILADAGYWSEENVKRLENERIEAFIATRRKKHGEPRRVAPRGRAPKTLTLRERMTRALSTVRGRKAYARRKAIVEPVFGQIKQARGFRQFLLRGLTQVKGEWALVTTAHNMLKLFTALELARAR